MTALTTEHVTVTLRDWLEQNVEGWRNVEVKPLNVALGSGFSAEIFFVDVAYTDDRGRQEQSLVVRRQPTDFEVVLGSSLALQGKMMAGLNAWGGVPVPPWIGMELDPTVLGMAFLIMGQVDGRSATPRHNYIVAGWIVDMTPQQRFDALKNSILSFAQLSDRKSTRQTSSNYCA